MNKFGEMLKGLREEENISRAQLAAELSVSARLIGYWENNQRECDFDTLIKIADYFSVTVDYILGRKDYLIRRRPFSKRAPLNMYSQRDDKGL